MSDRGKKKLEEDQPLPFSEKKKAKLQSCSSSHPKQEQEQAQDKWIYRQDIMGLFTGRERKKLEDYSQPQDLVPKETIVSSLANQFSNILHNNVEPSWEAIGRRVQKKEDCKFVELPVKHSKSVTAVAITDDDKKVISASKDGTIRQWDVNQNRTSQYTLPSRNPKSDPKKEAVLAVAVDAKAELFQGDNQTISSLSFRENTSDLCSGSSKGKFIIWDTRKLRSKKTFNTCENLWGLEWLPGHRLMTFGQKTVRLYKLNREEFIDFKSGPSGCFLSSLDTSSETRYEDFLSGTFQGSIILWNTHRKEYLYTINNAHGQDSMPTAEKMVHSITVCRGSDLAASGGNNGVVRLWEIVRDPKRLQDQERVRSLYDVPLVCFLSRIKLFRLMSIWLNSVAWISIVHNAYSYRTYLRLYPH
ncbi:hypothetical protein IFM89_017040 [Coptis chinensis]|uniref:Uncharacterized protein n=1 Tax=Coptis chinensis TaxID=261450 RepID=A0A835LN49_9MAGN|nr:hypothetical protein IFM89_017040 [Coptis chinensis]